MNLNWYKIAQLIRGDTGLNMFQDVTGISDYDYLLENPTDVDKQDQYDSVEIVYMSPDEYANRVKIGFWNNLSTDQKIKYKSTDEYWDKQSSKGIDVTKAKMYAERALKGDKFPIPYIAYDIDKGNMLQEGNHRAMAAKILGIESIPVCLINKSYANLDENFDEEEEILKQEVEGFVHDLDYHEILNVFWRFVSEPYDLLDGKQAMEWYGEEIDNAQENGNTLLFNREDLINSIKNDPETLKYVMEYMSNNNIDIQNPSTEDILNAVKYADNESVLWHYMYTWEKMKQYLNKLGVMNENTISPLSELTKKMSTKNVRRIFKEPDEIAKEIIQKMNQEEIVNAVRKHRLYEKTYSWKGPLNDIQDPTTKWNSLIKSIKDYDDMKI